MPDSPSRRNGTLAFLDPENWPALARYGALLVVCALCFLYGLAQQKNYETLSDAYRTLAHECIEGERRAQVNGRLLEQLRRDMLAVRRRLEALRAAGVRGPD